MITNTSSSGITEASSKAPWLQNPLQKTSNKLIQQPGVMERLIDVIKHLSLARDIETVTQIIRIVARELTGADGATFVLRDREMCFYAEENAIEPLWKGMRFPMQVCVSGWAMLNKTVVVIPDIYKDARVPQDAYRPTFVKSLIMVPIRVEAPIGAIGNYWAKTREATSDEIEILQILADATSMALENIQLYAELERRVKERTQQLEEANKELESFSYSISHDLRTPLRSIAGLSEILTNNYEEKLDEKAKKYLTLVFKGTQQMDALIDAILKLSRISRGAIDIHQGVNLSDMAQELIEELKHKDPGRNVVVKIQPGLIANVDRVLFRSVLQNLLGNAWKYSSKHELATIEFGKTCVDGIDTYFVKDDGAGFDMNCAVKLFKDFQRMHTDKEFEGTGVGLSIVAKIIHKHGGKIWAEAEVEKGATFYFTIS